MAHLYEFDSFQVDEEKRLLRQNEEIVALKPKTFDTLLALVKSAGKIVSKDELVREIWNGSAVSDDSLTQQISRLRKILGDPANQHRYIVTIPGVGYKFVADICQRANNGLKQESENVSENGLVDYAQVNSEIAASPPGIEMDQNSLPSNEWKVSGNSALKFAPPPQYAPSINARKRLRINYVIIGLIVAAIGALSVGVWQWSEKQNLKSSREVKSIAVLPFKTFGNDKEGEVLKMGMTDALINKLSRLEQIRVLPTSAVSRFNKLDQDSLAAGKELNVDAVLDGRIQKNGERLRVTTQLITIADGKTVWAESYDEDFSGVFEIQDRTAGKIAETLSLELSADDKRALMKRYTNSAKAYQLYLEGRRLFHLRTADSGDLGRNNFQLAIEEDPKFALAYAVLGITYLIDPPKNLPPRNAFLKAKELAKQAQEIDNTLAEAYATYGFAVWRGEWNWQEAESNFKRAVELDRQSFNAYGWYALLLSGHGKHQEALILIDKSAVDKIPALTAKASAYVAAREYDKAIETAHQLLDKSPNSHNALLSLSWSYLGKEDFEQAISYVDKDVALYEAAPHDSRAIQAHIYARAGRKEDARRILSEIRKAAFSQPRLNGAQAIAHAALGEKDEAFKFLEKAIDEGEWWCYLLKVHLMFDPLRDDPRFQEMLRRINLEN